MSKIMVLLSIVGLLIASAAIAKPAAKSSSGAVIGLRMLISPDENAVAQNKETHFRVEFRNVGHQDITISPGSLQRCDGQRGETE